MKQKIGVVDVGGGFRGAYAAGVLDYCMHKDIWFDLGIGVSAGSANLLSYCARQPMRNFRFYTEYALRKEHMSLSNYIHTRSYLNLEYLYGTLSNSTGADPIDYDAMRANPMELLTVISEAETGMARYIPKWDIARDCYTHIMASCAIPGICRPVIIGAMPFYDGALGDPVPVKKAFEKGCDKVVLILTLPENTIRKPDKDEKLARRIRKEFPKAADALKNRANKYNEGVALAKQYADKGKLLIVAPDNTCGVNTLCRDSQAIKSLYRKGYGDGPRIVPFLST